MVLPFNVKTPFVQWLCLLWFLFSTIPKTPVSLYTSYMPLHRIFCYVHAGLYLNGCMDVHLASLHGHMKTIKYLYMQLFQARRNVTSILLVLAWPTNRKSTQNKEFKNAESNIKHARNTTHWHRYYCVFKTQRRI